MLHSCNAGTQEAEAGGYELEVSHLGHLSEFKASLHYIERSYLSEWMNKLNLKEWTYDINILGIFKFSIFIW